MQLFLLLHVWHNVNNLAKHVIVIRYTRDAGIDAVLLWKYHHIIDMYWAFLVYKSADDLNLLYKITTQNWRFESYLCIFIVPSILDLFWQVQCNRWPWIKLSLVRFMPESIVDLNIDSHFHILDWDYFHFAHDD